MLIRKSTFSRAIKTKFDPEFIYRMVAEVRQEWRIEKQTLDSKIKKHPCFGNKIFNKLGFLTRECESNVFNLHDLVCDKCLKILDDLPTGIGATCAVDHCPHICKTEFACIYHLCHDCSHMRSKDYMYPFLLCLNRNKIWLPTGVKIMIFDRILHHYVNPHDFINSYGGLRVHVSIHDEITIRKLLKWYPKVNEMCQLNKTCISYEKEGYKLSDNCTKIIPYFTYEGEYENGFCVNCFAIN
jgi:hypothetical protein